MSEVGAIAGAMRELDPLPFCGEHDSVLTDDVTTADGRSALALARELNTHELISLLERYGAR